MKSTRRFSLHLSKDEELGLLFALLCLVFALGFLSVAEARTRAGWTAEGAPSLADVTLPSGAGGAGSSDAGGSGISDDPGVPGSSDVSGGSGTSFRSTGDLTAPEGSLSERVGASANGAADAESAAGAAEARSAESAGTYPQTGAFPIILAVFGLGVALAIVWLVLTFRKPRKLGGSKGDVW